MVIRVAKANDAYGMARVRVLGWRTTYRGIVPTEHLLKMSSGAIEWADRIRTAINHREAHGYVAVYDDEIVGFVLYGEERTGEYPDHKNEVYAIYILEEHQGNGIGSKLLEHAVQSMCGAGLLIWSLELNPYRSFYEQKEGQIIDTKDRVIGELSLREVAYGWETAHHDAIVGA